MFDLDVIVTKRRKNKPVDPLVSWHHETTRDDRPKSLRLRHIEAKHLRLHDAVKPVFEVYELLNPPPTTIGVGPPLGEPQFLAVSGSPHNYIVSGFHAYRRLSGDDPITCYIRPIANESQAMLRMLAWDHVFSITPWRALSNYVLARFYEQHLHRVPAAVLLRHGWLDDKGNSAGRTSVHTFAKATGISRKTLHRQCPKGPSNAVSHKTHEQLLETYGPQTT